MYRMKQLFGVRLSLRNYNAQVGETYAMIKALNKLTGLGMPEIRTTQLQAFWFSDQITQQDHNEFFGFIITKCVECFNGEKCIKFS